MKKATDSKNMGKITELLPIMQENFGNSPEPCAHQIDSAMFTDYYLIVRKN